MNDVLHLDLETTSKCPIEFGQYRYGSDPSTRVLLAAVAKGDMRPVVWRFNDPEHPESVEAIRLLSEDTTTLVYAHNAPFEIALSSYRFKDDLGIDAPAIERFRCTQAMCRRAAVPESLANAATFLRLPELKNKSGKALIHVFADQNRPVTLKRGKGKAEEKMVTANPILEDPVPWDWTFTLGGAQVTVREAWEMYIEYCRQDAVVERQIHSKLGIFEMTGGILDGFLFDLRMNHRGVPVDVPALQRALTLVNDYEAELSIRFKELTGLEPGQRARVLEWLTEWGYPALDLKAETVEEVLAIEPCPLEESALEALQIKSMLSFAAVKKVKAMLDWVCPDGRIRGAFVWHGAVKTGRWTSKGPQFQNMKKPPKWMKPLMATIYRAVSEWADNGDLKILFGNPFEVLACCSRYFVRDPEGPVYDVDFSQVEARILPALIECDRILDKFRRGEDPYLDVAEKLNTTRDMGKVISLLCQFGGGWVAVKVPLGDKITEKEARRAVAVYREENPEVKAAWKHFGDKFLEALNSPGKWVAASGHVKFGFVKKAPFPRMVMRLPSGRDIVYPYPKAEPITMFQKKTTKVVKLEDGTDMIQEGRAEWTRVKGHVEYGDRYFFHTHELYFYGLIKGKTYGWVKTYGGDLLQSATQGTGMDFLMHGCVVAERKGFEPFFVVHDQALAAARGGLENFVGAICTRPAWFADFPLEAEGTLADSYSKD